MPKRSRNDDDEEIAPVRKRLRTFSPPRVIDISDESDEETYDMEVDSDSDSDYEHGILIPNGYRCVVGRYMICTNDIRPYQLAKIKTEKKSWNKRYADSQFQLKWKHILQHITDCYTIHLFRESPTTVVCDLLTSGSQYSKLMRGEFKGALTSIKNNLDKKVKELTAFVNDDPHVAQWLQKLENLDVFQKDQVQALALA